MRSPSALAVGVHPLPRGGEGQRDVGLERGRGRHEVRVRGLSYIVGRQRRDANRGERPRGVCGYKPDGLPRQGRTALEQPRDNVLGRVGRDDAQGQGGGGRLRRQRTSAHLQAEAACDGMAGGGRRDRGGCIGERVQPRRRVGGGGIHHRQGQGGRREGGAEREHPFPHDGRRRPARSLLGGHPQLGEVRAQPPVCLRQGRDVGRRRGDGPQGRRAQGDGLRRRGRPDVHGLRRDGSARLEVCPRFG